MIVLLFLLNLAAHSLAASSASSTSSALLSSQSLSDGKLLPSDSLNTRVKPSLLAATSLLTNGRYDDDDVEDTISSVNNDKYKTIQDQIVNPSNMGISDLGDDDIDREYSKSLTNGYAKAPISYPAICKPKVVHVFSEQTINCACRLQCQFVCPEGQKTDQAEQRQKTYRQLSKSGSMSESTNTDVSSKKAGDEKTCRRVCTQKPCKRPKFHMVYSYQLINGLCRKWRVCIYKARCEGKQRRWLHYYKTGCTRLLGRQPEEVIEYPEESYGRDNTNSDVMKSSYAPQVQSLNPSNYWQHSKRGLSGRYPGTTNRRNNLAQSSYSWRNRLFGNNRRSSDDWPTDTTNEY